MLSISRTPGAVLDPLQICYVLWFSKPPKEKRIYHLHFMDDASGLRSITAGVKIQIPFCSPMKPALFSLYRTVRGSKGGNTYLPAYRCCSLEQSRGGIRVLGCGGGGQVECEVGLERKEGGVGLGDVGSYWLVVRPAE